MKGPAFKVRLRVDEGVASIVAGSMIAASSMTEMKRMISVPFILIAGSC